MASAKIKVNSTSLSVPNPPTLSYNDKTDVLSASSPLGNSEIIVSVNGGPFGAYTGQIAVGNVDRPAGYWQFKVKAATNRAESAIASSPLFTSTLQQTIVGVTLVNADNATDIVTINTGDTLDLATLPSRNVNIRANTSGTVGSVVLSLTGAVSHLQTETAAPYALYGDSGGVYNAWTPVVGSYSLVVTPYSGAGGTGTAGTPATFLFSVVEAGTTVTPAPPTVLGDDGANTLQASHPLGDSEILVSENNAAYTAYAGIINVGNVVRAAGYWKFKTRAATNRNESPVALSPAFTIPVPVSGGTPSYTLSAPASVSAGVFKTDGTLIRTMFGNIQKAAGTYPIYWDGKNDVDTLVPDGTYTIKVASNNIQAQWAVIGNTSANTTGPTVHNYSGTIRSLVFNGNYAYFTTGYNERQSSYFKFLLSDIQKKIEIITDASAAIQIVATDGIRTYHGGLFGGATQAIFATEVSNDAYSTFSSGVALKAYNAHAYSSVIDVTTTTLPGDPYDTTNPTKAPSYGGMAVQRTGNYLFVSYVDNSQLHVLNKTSGTLVQTITTFTPPRALAVDNNNNLWIVSGANTVARYSVNSDGTLSGPTLTLSGLVNPLSLSVSPDNTTIAIADGGTRQQVRFFNTTTGAEGTPLGQLGGYVNSPDVANDKFMFKNLKQLERDESTFVAYAPDGSLWLGDQGNLRTLHFSANRTYIEKIQAMGYLYSVFADRHNPSRVFANYLEFNVDWTKPLNVTDGSNGLWTHTKNWGYNITYYYDNQFFRMKGVTTLSNGRTYCMLQHRGTNTSKWNIAELTSTGLRFGVEPNTNNSANDLNYGFNDDGSLLYIDNTNSGTPTKWYKKALTGFDGSNNPQWGAPQQIASITNTVGTDAINSAWWNENLITSSGKIAMINNEGSNSGYHIGIVPLGASDWSAQTARETFIDYKGEFPDDGTYDIGNGVHFTGGSLGMTADNLILQGFRGEFWKATQTNKWNIFSDNGLHLKQFGATGVEAHLVGEAAPQMAGSMYSGTFMKLPNGDMALVHNNESIEWHGAAHIWKLTGTNTIQEQSISISKSGTPFVPPVDYIDLLSDIPFRGTLTNGIGKWTTSGDAGGQTILTDTLVYKKGERSILIRSDGQNRWLQGNLGTINAANWKMTCDMSYPEGQEPGDNFFDILDISNRIILRISRPQTSYPNIAIKANSATVATGLQNVIAYKPLPLVISISGSTISVTFSNYPTVTTGVSDALADITKPKNIRFSTNSTPAAHQISISNLRLYLTLT